MNAECLCAVLWEWISMMWDKKKKRKEMDALRSLSCGFLISVCDTSGPLEVSFCIPEQETDNLVDCSTIYTLIKCSIFPVFGKNAAWRKQSVLITLDRLEVCQTRCICALFYFEILTFCFLSLWRAKKERVLLVNRPSIQSVSWLFLDVIFCSFVLSVNDLLTGCFL